MQRNKKLAVVRVVPVEEGLGPYVADWESTELYVVFTPKLLNRGFICYVGEI